MEYLLQRFSSGDDDTLGALFRVTERRQFLCFTLEDEMREEKVPGETRIPQGRYEIKLRPEGGMYARYRDRYEWHRPGMLWLQNVQGFEWIYIHPGNTDDDTSGCILVGDGVHSNITEDGGRLLQSVPAYARLYKELAALLLSGEAVFLTIKDYA